MTPCAADIQLFGMNRHLLHDDLTHSVIGAFYEVYNTLHATNLEVGLLLHFGTKAQFFRIVCEKDFKAREE
jgi:hypothetical protein